MLTTQVEIPQLFEMFWDYIHIIGTSLPTGNPGDIFSRRLIHFSFIFIIHRHYYYLRSDRLSSMLGIGLLNDFTASQVKHENAFTAVCYTLATYTLNFMFVLGPRGLDVEMENIFIFWRALDGNIPQ